MKGVTNSDWRGREYPPLAGKYGGQGVEPAQPGDRTVRKWASWCRGCAPSYHRGWWRGFIIGIVASAVTAALTFLAVEYKDMLF
jgi:hypothetical protein